ncbi:unnamed protein product [Urochloa decumbens]|uniref:Uncharacterized protein n=1 Tax=Urochloa decumbens TaxID=240449 RepID=A0ABC8XVI4_9POAL
MSFAGVSIISDDGVASGSAVWDTAADSFDGGYHLLVVRGYSRTKETTPNGNSINSQQFRVGGHRWHIEYYPNGWKSKHVDYLSLYLRLDGHVAEHDVKFQFEFSFIDQVERQEPSRIRTMQSRGIPGDFGWGYPCFVRRSVFEGSRHLKNDSFTVRCDIVVITDTDRRPSSAAVVVSPPPSIQQHLGSLLMSGEGADVTFEVGGETFTAHRCVLAARSPVFRAGLFGPMKEGTTTSAIRIDDMEPQVFGLLLSFIYTDLVLDDHVVSGCGNHRDDDKMILWQNLLVAADIYDLQKLRLVCEENLCRYIEADTVEGIVALAEQHNCQGLKGACLDFSNSPQKEEVIAKASFA